MSATQMKAPHSANRDAIMCIPKLLLAAQVGDFHTCSIMRFGPALAVRLSPTMEIKEAYAGHAADQGNEASNGHCAVAGGELLDDHPPELFDCRSLVLACNSGTFHTRRVTFCGGLQQG